MVKPRIPELETSFFCCSLRTGSVIISAVSVVVFTILSLILGVLVVYATIERLTSEQFSDGFHGFHSKFIFLNLVLALVVCILFEVLSFLLWIGIKQYKETYVLSWAIMLTAFNFIQVMVMLFIFTFTPTDFTQHYITYSLIVLEICGFFYVALVVYSYYREIRRLKNAPQSFRNEA